MNATHSERERFVADLIRACPKATASTCQRLLRLGAAYKRCLARCGDGAPRYVLDRRYMLERRLKTVATQIDAFALPTTGARTVSIMVKGQMIPIPTS